MAEIPIYIQAIFFCNAINYSFENIFFRLCDIKEYEKDNPYLFYEPAGHICFEQESSSPLHTGLNTLSYSEIIEKLKITPIELLDILNGVREWVDFQGEIEKRLVTTDEIEFRAYKESTGGNYFNANNLHSVKVYQRDFDLFCEKWAEAPEAEKPVPIEAQGQLAGLQSKNAELEARIKDLEAQLEQAKQAYPEAPEAQADTPASENMDASLIAELKAKLAEYEANAKATFSPTVAKLFAEKVELKGEKAKLESRIIDLEDEITELIENSREEAPQEPEADVPARGEAGRAANSEKALARWQAVIPAMLEVWHSIMSAEAKQYTRAKIEKRLREHGKKQAPNRPQLDFFMDCLPSEYKVPQSGSEKK